MEREPYHATDNDHFSFFIYALAADLTASANANLFYEGIVTEW